MTNEGLETPEDRPPIVPPYPNAAPIKNKEYWECEKLRAETKQLDTPCYKRLSFYTSLAPFAPVLFISLTIWYTYKSGWFDTQNKALEAKKFLLQQETNRLEQATKALETKEWTLTNRIAFLETELVSNKLYQAALLKEFNSNGGKGFIELSETNATLGSVNDSQSFQIHDPHGQGWSVESKADWITISVARSGKDGQVYYTVNANPSTNARTGEIVVAGRSHIVTQGGKPVR